MPAIGLLVFALAAGATAQTLDPVHWALEPSPAKSPPGAVLTMKLTATMEEGWHLYSLTTARPPIATTIKLAGETPAGDLRVFAGSPARKFDFNFNVETETYDRKAIFYLVMTLPREAPRGEIPVAVEVRYQACNDRLCLNPKRKTVPATVIADPAAAPPPSVVPPGFTEVKPASAPPPPLGTPTDTQGTGAFLLVAFGFGLAAVFTPCVFPMIPITVSFFAARRGSAVQAAVFCLGIVVLFTALGLLTSLALGPFGVVQLGSNPWVNGFIALVLFAFSLNLLGAFEMVLPSGLLTRLDRSSQRGGVAGTLLMGLTFSLTSFACVGPFMGTLLAASVGSGGLRPLLGMAAFAAGLAAPFFFLALFPSWLGRLPRSGAWLPRVKVVMGFVVLALMLKYLSNVDQVLEWNLLTRERFLAGWVVLFALPGMYLAGWLRFEGINPDEPVGVKRLLVAASFLVFSLSLAPGMFGVRLGEIEAYLPPPDGGFARGSAQAQLQWMKNQYREALDVARRENKLVLVSFTGYACTNCHWMKANMFTRPEIAEALGKFVFLELYTDGADAVSRENQRLQEKRFGSVAIPFYVILNAEEKTLASFGGLTRNKQEFLSFLRTGS